MIIFEVFDYSQCEQSKKVMPQGPSVLFVGLTPKKIALKKTIFGGFFAF